MIEAFCGGIFSRNSTLLFAIKLILLARLAAPTSQLLCNWAAWSHRNLLFFDGEQCLSGIIRYCECQTSNTARKRRSLKTQCRHLQTLRLNSDVDAKPRSLKKLNKKNCSRIYRYSWDNWSAWRLPSWQTKRCGVRQYEERKRRCIFYMYFEKLPENSKLGCDISNKSETLYEHHFLVNKFHIESQRCYFTEKCVYKKDESHNNHNKKNGNKFERKDDVDNAISVTGFIGIAIAITIGTFLFATCLKCFCNCDGKDEENSEAATICYSAGETQPCAIERPMNAPQITLPPMLLSNEMPHEQSSNHHLDGASVRMYPEEPPPPYSN